MTIHAIRCKPDDGSLLHRNGIYVDEGIDVEPDIYDDCQYIGCQCERTGFYFDVQAEFLMQDKFIHIIFDAIIQIENYDPEFMFDFAFAGGCVKSVACAVLLASLVYPTAQITFEGERSKRAAAAAGFRELTPVT